MASTMAKTAAERKMSYVVASAWGSRASQPIKMARRTCTESCHMFYNEQSIYSGKSTFAWASARIARSFSTLKVLMDSINIKTTYLALEGRLPSFPGCLSALHSDGVLQ